MNTFFQTWKPCKLDYDKIWMSQVFVINTKDF